SQEKDSKLHNHGSVLSPANSAIDSRILPGPRWGSRDHLLDTDLRAAPFGIFYTNRDFTADDPSSDRNRRNAHQRLAFRSDNRAALAQHYSAGRCRIDVRAPDRLPPRSSIGD